MTRRRAATLTVALVVLGIGAFAFAFRSPVPLLTGPPHGEENTTGPIGCFTNHADGALIVHEQYGTAIIDTQGGGLKPLATPIMWRPGFTARRSGFEVEVLDANGLVVATTGRTYSIAGGYVGENPRVFWACDFVRPQV